MCLWNLSRLSFCFCVEDNFLVCVRASSVMIRKLKRFVRSRRRVLFVLLLLFFFECYNCLCVMLF